ncbi:hypothetical protein BOC42_08500 [Burkholderia pseudomallei]|nr:hypothetical protein BOC37_31000 [Burkholderia pseudomallei]ARK87402.1 hypothetical protein BOC42_08500 [Burkholderia pseudomallei]ARL85633.1 hypothetical protein BOC57_05015 [Burkholderia pseudomallei]ARL97201.1 hypothetical protein BOC58_31360 [Burkholderia pseudomallei]ARL99571.1 hypothetical protein BOC59_05375 [Burkholderia pseudomallei]
MGMGVFSITPLKNKNPPLGEGLSAIWAPRQAAPFLHRRRARAAARRFAPVSRRACGDRRRTRT